MNDVQATRCHDRSEESRLRARLAALEEDLDPPVCRLQFPDGTVPCNAREAGEGWKKWADEFQRRAKLWEQMHDARTKHLDGLRHACLAALGFLGGVSILTKEQLQKTLADAVKASGANEKWRSG